MTRKGRSASLVFTTIFDPYALDLYFENFKKFGHLEQVKIFMIADLKTPRAAFERCQTLRDRGMTVYSPSVDEQERFLERVGLLRSFVPMNSDNRRNVGYLMALESGSDFVMSIDDDNLCMNGEDFFLEHSIVCADDTSTKAVESSTQWINICALLDCDPPVTTYARGFPYYARHKKETLHSYDALEKIHINAGLWIGDPDVDAISWLVNPTRARSFRGPSMALGQKTWSPINTQNTSLRRDAIAAYYFVKMNYPLAGFPIDRYGDIFSGFFVEACAKHVGGGIRVGSPIAEHKRNTHNYMKDSAGELGCITVLEDLLPWLTEELKLSGKTYSEAYLSLSEELPEVVERMKGSMWTDATRGYFHQMTYCMKKWLSACKSVG